jgi:hypothetical protein
MNRTYNILNSFEKIAEAMPPVEPSDRVKNILRKAAAPAAVPTPKTGAVLGKGVPLAINSSKDHTGMVNAMNANADSSNQGMTNEEYKRSLRGPKPAVKTPMSKDLRSQVATPSQAGAPGTATLKAYDALRKRPPVRLPKEAVDLTDRLRNSLQKLAICPEMLGINLGETPEEEAGESPEEEATEDGVKVVSMGDDVQQAPQEESEEAALEDAIEDGFSKEKMAGLVSLIEEYTAHLTKQAEAPEVAERKGTENEDNQGNEEVPTQITDNSAENLPPKGVSAKADETDERKKAEDEQSGEENEKVAMMSPPKQTPVPPPTPTAPPTKKKNPLVAANAPDLFEDDERGKPRSGTASITKQTAQKVAAERLTIIKKLSTQLGLL